MKECEKTGRRTGEVAEDKITQSDGASVGLKGVLPVLVNAKAVETRLGAEILEGDISDVA